MNITFLFYLKNSNSTPQSIVFNETNTFLDFKKYIVNLISKDVSDITYVDINILLERPIRAFGKQILEPGLLPRTMDNFKFSEFNLDNREITCEYIPVSDYNPFTKKIEENERKSQNPSSIYQAPGIKKTAPIQKKKEFNLLLDSDQDFPKLC